jgi:hypothetical protein
MANTVKYNLPAPEGGGLIIYQTDDGQTRLQVRLEDESVWLTQKLMAELFQKDVRTINEHIQNIFEESELQRDGTIRKFRIVQLEGARSVEREVDFYNLDVIISVGYRVKSRRGTQFRQWATQRLREYLIKGFTLDDMRLKEDGGGSYFDELLARIRDIRSSEKVFWRKVLEIYATSLDYDPSEEASRLFFATVQNKMHWGAHGQTAAEVIRARADAAKPNMGLTAWTGSRPRKMDVAVAKNYLKVEEIEALNLIVSMYLDFAELQARSQKPMYMRDWIAKLDDFLRISDREILSHAGRVSHEAALSHAEAEFETWRQRTLAEPSLVDKHFQEAIEQMKQLKTGPGPKRKKKQ